MGDLTASGQWPHTLAQAHINLLELEAVWMALHQFRCAAEGKHVLINTDNTTVAFYVNKQGGGSFLFPVQACGGIAPLVSRPEHPPVSEISPRQVERPSRLLEQISYDPAHGMDVDSSGPGTGLVDLVQTPGRPICDEIQQTPPSLYLPSSRSPSLGSGRLVHFLDKSVGVCLSPLPHSGQGDQENKGGRGYSDSHSSQVGVSALVSRSVTSRHKRPNSPSSREAKSGSAKNRDSARKSDCSGLTRLATVRKSLSSQGASEDVINLVELAHRPSTQKVYTSRWRSWCKWLSLIHI